METFRRNAELLLTTLSKVRPGKPIFLITPIPWLDAKGLNPVGLTLTDYRRALETAAARFPLVHVVRGETLVPEDAQFFVDNLHPNDRGMRLYAQNLLKELGAGTGGKRE